MFKIQGIKETTSSVWAIKDLINAHKGGGWEMVNFLEIPLTGETRKVEFVRRDWASDDVERKHFTITRTKGAMCT